MEDLAKKLNLPTTEEGAINHLRSLIADEIAANSVVGIFKCRMAQGDDLYKAFGAGLSAIASLYKA